jgi:hypothetical protein
VPESRKKLQFGHYLFPLTRLPFLGRLDLSFENQWRAWDGFDRWPRRELLVPGVEFLLMSIARVCNKKTL